MAFSYIVGEIGKKSGIEISRGVGIVGAQMGPCEKDADCDEGNVCNLLSGSCEEGIEVGTNTNTGEKIKVPESQAGGENTLNYITQFLGIASTSVSLYQAFTPATPAGGTTVAEGMLVGGASAQGASLGSQLFAGGGGAGGGTISTAGSMSLNVIGSVFAAIAVAAAIYFIFKAAGASPQNLNMIMTAGVVGASVGIAASFIPMFVVIIGTELTAGPVGWVAAAVTLIIMAVWIFFGYQEYLLELIVYQVNAWQPQEGGANCDKCNKIEFGCTEYQCKTFGQSCGIVNKGTTQEKCVWENPDDREYPVITENITISKLPESYTYKKSTEISPPDTGVEITSNSQNCIPPFSSLTLGVKTDEPAQCRISTNREKNFDLMTKDMDEGALKIEKHTKIIPNSATANDWALNNLVDNSGLPDENQDGVADVEFEITKGNEYEYYIKCKDTNGNENPANFVIKFCVQDKDLTAPMIKGFFVADKSFVQFNTSNVVTEVYTNEPAECKWDFNDKTYTDLQYGMTNCDTTINQATISGNSCTGTFTGLENGEENKYYIRCQDRSEDKNTNSVSEVYTLKVSSQPVLINSIKVNGKGNNSIIKDARNVIPVDLEIKTSFGAENGKAKCSYGYLGNQISMSFDYAEINTQTLWLPEGEYTLPISCNDIAGDTSKSSISFKIEKDIDAPIVARAYYDANNLKVITNEPAECVYTLQSNLACAYEFKDGTAMSEIGELTHYTSWQAGKKYYIKCKDAFGNQPLPGQCNIIVKAFESYK